MIFTKSIILFVFLLDPDIDHFCFSAHCQDQSAEVEQEAERIDNRANIVPETRVYHRGLRVDVEPFNLFLDDCVLKSDFKKIVVFAESGRDLDPKVNHRTWRELVTMAASVERCVETSEIYMQGGKYAYAVCDAQTVLISTIRADYCSKSQEIIDILSYPPVEED